MTHSNFQFLATEYKLLFNIVQAAEYNLYRDPVTSLVKLRQFIEKLCDHLYEEHHLEFPYENTFHNRLKNLEFEGVLPDQIKDLLHSVKSKGNIAVHEVKGTTEEAKSVLFSTFKIAKWFYEVYAKVYEDLSQLKFRVPEDLDARDAFNQLKGQYEALLKQFDEFLVNRDKSELPSQRLQEIKEKSKKAARKIDMSEAETRQIIDEQLRLAGWEVDTIELNFKVHQTLPERGRNLAIAEWPCQGKWADYALFIGLELYAIVEAKKYASNISTDLHQSKIYAEIVDDSHDILLLGSWGNYKVPFLFSTNGRPYLQQIATKSGIWFLDVRNEYNHSRALQGWYTPDGLTKLLEQNLKGAEEKLRNTPPDFLEIESGLGLRKYQLKAIRKVEEKLIQHPDNRRTLIAMATGTGKTRTIIGLCYRLIQSNRFQRILFLVDRTLLAKQALGAFKDNKIVGLNTFSEIYDVKGLKDIVPELDTRLHFSTVQGMVKRLFYHEGQDKPAVDQYDCIIIDEAHRGYLLDRELDEEDLEFRDQRDYVSKYRMVLDYFDAHAIGLTATPALHTRQIFGKAVFTYSYREAVIDGYLIDHDPPMTIRTKLGEEGIVWEKGERPQVYVKESNIIEELEELEDELKIEIAGFNKLVLSEQFNRTVIRRLVKELDPDGEEKTLIFAATDDHADDVVQYLKEEFKASGIDVADDAIEKITGSVYDPEELLNRFKNEKYPNIAVTVDLLTTGVDVPSICNLVFLRRIKSRILYEQMLGRATRRCDEIGKEVFHIYDAVKIYETLEDFTQMKPVVPNPKTTFEQLVEELDHIDNEDRARRQVEQIIAKLQRKRRQISDDNKDHFLFNSDGVLPEELIEDFKQQDVRTSMDQIRSLTDLWKFLDGIRPPVNPMLVSHHEDEFLAMEPGFGDGQQPEDYLESFAAYIKENQNKIQALNIVCTRPAELDRKSLRELILVLDQQGYRTNHLQVAWKQAKNEDIAADLISFIRTLSLGSELISHEERITGAVNQIRKMRNLSKVQQKWLDRFEKQLIQESVLRIEDLDDSPFDDAGGFERLNKIFNNELGIIIKEINRNLYQSA